MKIPQDVVEAARALTPRALAALDRALDDPDRAIAAAVAILDRAWGKPAQAILAQVQGSIWAGGIDGPPQIEGPVDEWLRQRRIELGLEPPAAPDGRETHKEWEERRYRELDLLDKPGRP